MALVGADDFSLPCSAVASCQALDRRNSSTTPHSRHAYTLDHVKPLHGQENGTFLVLSVDDDPVAHLVLREMLTPEGYEVRRVAWQVPEGFSVTVLASLSSLCLQRRQHMQWVFGHRGTLNTVKMPAPEGRGVSDLDAAHLGCLPCIASR